MQLTTTAFLNNGTIPSVHTCDGSNAIVPLTILDASQGARSLVLVMDDPDVPRTIRPDGNFDHWVMFNIPPDTTTIDSDTVPGAVSGANGAGRLGYFGPCPPDREHRYFFRLYALDILLDLPSGSTKSQVLEATLGHVIECAELVGRYERGKWA